MIVSKNGTLNYKKSANEIRVRDLERNPVTQLSKKTLLDLQNETSPIYKEHLLLINKIKEADVVIIAAPMYNFTIPVSLKSYFDAISKNGLTFKYGEDGNPVGFLKGKKTYVVWYFHPLVNLAISFIKNRLFIINNYVIF